MSLCCLIPSYNEAKRISKVLEPALDCAFIDEIWVIDDCSTDQTADIVNAFAKVKFLRNERNLGKTKTIARGLKAIQSDHVLFLDADLIGLNTSDIDALCQPVLEGDKKWSVSLRGNAPKLWRQIGIDYISGERVLPMSLFDGQMEALERLPKFGLEVFINRLILAQNLHGEIVTWPEVSSPIKARKHGFVKGVTGDILMLRDMFKTIPPWQAITQIRQLKALCANP